MIPLLHLIRFGLILIAFDRMLDALSEQVALMAPCWGRREPNIALGTCLANQNTHAFCLGDVIFLLYIMLVPAEKGW